MSGEDIRMHDTIAMIVAIVIVVVGIVWAVWFENFAGRDVEPKEADTEESDTEKKSL